MLMYKKEGKKNAEFERNILLNPLYKRDNLRVVSKRAIVQLLSGTKYYYRCYL